MREVQHGGRGASRLAENVHERFFGGLGAGVGEERRKAERVHRELLELVKQRRAQMILSGTCQGVRPSGVLGCMYDLRAVEKGSNGTDGSERRE